MRKRFILLILFASVYPFQIQADVYKYTNPNTKNTYYTDDKKICSKPGYKCEIIFETSPEEKAERRREAEARYRNTVRRKAQYLEDVEIERDRLRRLREKTASTKQRS